MAPASSRRQRCSSSADRQWGGMSGRAHPGHRGRHARRRKGRGRQHSRSGSPGKLGGAAGGVAPPRPAGLRSGVGCALGGETRTRGGASAGGGGALGQRAVGGARGSGLDASWWGGSGRGGSPCLGLPAEGAGLGRGRSWHWWFRGRVSREPGVCRSRYSSLGGFRTQLCDSWVRDSGRQASRLRRTPRPSTPACARPFPKHLTRSAPGCSESAFRGSTERASRRPGTSGAAGGVPSPAPLWAPLLVLLGGARRALPLQGTHSSPRPLPCFSHRWELVFSPVLSRSQFLLL